MSELRITDTNSVNDSKGRAFGLEGNDFIYVLIAFVVSLGAYLVFAFLFRVGMAVALMFSVPVLVAVLAWVLLFRHNKPEGYAEDFFDDLVNGEGWSLSAPVSANSPQKESHAQ
ncbi:MAG: hypothetical protein Q8N18_26035 [Opitutaceae bacterium]|nr:hypothetical protein [Opitutaceae bacterium]